MIGRLHQLAGQAEIHGHRSLRPPCNRQRDGAIILVSALMMILMMAILALCIDVGYVATVQAEMDRAAQSGGLVGAATLGNGATEAPSAVASLMARHGEPGSETGVTEVAPRTGYRTSDPAMFLPSPILSEFRARVRHAGQPILSPRVSRRGVVGASSHAVATVPPREIMLVLDYSASMNDDSELRSIATIGRAEVEANLKQIYQELGAPSCGKLEWTPVYISSHSTHTIKGQLGLLQAPYPFPSGSWDDYIDYVRTSPLLADAGYQKKYGYLTLTNYWLEKMPRHSQTPGLWKTREQPITAVKDAVAVFSACLHDAESDDRIGLSVYTASNQRATLESPLTSDFQRVESIARQRQAGHYDTMTNIGAGLQIARLELEERARPGALRTIVLLTVGVANLPHNPSYARQFALTEAERCADNHFPIVTISLGAAADTELMDAIAQVTGGTHFRIPGGQSVAEYENDLQDAFRNIATDRSMHLAK